MPSRLHCGRTGPDRGEKRRPGSSAGQKRDGVKNEKKKDLRGRGNAGGMGLKARLATDR